MILLYALLYYFVKTTFTEHTFIHERNWKESFSCPDHFSVQEMEKIGWPPGPNHLFFCHVCGIDYVLEAEILLYIVTIIF